LDIGELDKALLGVENIAVLQKQVKKYAMSEDRAREVEEKIAELKELEKVVNRLENHISNETKEHEESEELINQINY